jgi:Flp pilus assembly pilin Flp
MQPRSTPKGAPFAAMFNDERGVATIEYALLCALIALAVVASVGAVGEGNAKAFDGVSHSLGHHSNGHGKGGGNSGNGKGNGGPAGP